jgi:hypothetical protein
MENSNFAISELVPHVYLVNFRSQFELAMTFLRAQEFYESSNPSFKGHIFNIVDYMRWYASTLGKGKFSYSEDWGGFNLPRQVLDKLYGNDFQVIEDFNAFDRQMVEIYEAVSKSDDNFVLIGVSHETSYLLPHELAHGLYATNEAYRKAMFDELQSTPLEVIGEMRKILGDMGYCEEVIMDEIQAYFSTGLLRAFEENEVIKNFSTSNFKDIFQNFAPNHITSK